MTVEYRVELYDTWGRRVAVFGEVPLLEATRTAPDKPDRIRGLLPNNGPPIGHGYRIRVLLGGACACEATVSTVLPQWGDTRKLIVDRYVRFHEVLEIGAERPAREGNTHVSQGFANKDISAIVKSVINTARGSIHYLVDHDAYPDGAEREYGKFLARRTTENELEVGGIAEGQWVGGARVDASSAYAKDGDTISGLVVDGTPWPDVRLMMIDCEETSRNSHAISRHPEVADWPADRYAASGYKIEAEAAKDALQNLLTSKGIDSIELNPHKDSSGAYDDRVDAYGRYLGLIFGGGECFNAALVEMGVADVCLYDEGRYCPPEMELKDFFSYVGENTDSVEETGVVLTSFDVAAGALEVLTPLAYAAGGFVWSVDTDLAVRFRKAEAPDRAWYYDSLEMGVSLGSESANLVNVIHFSGNPVAASVVKTYVEDASEEAYGYEARGLDYFGISVESDADALVEGILADVAYPETNASAEFFRGNANVDVGDLVEFRGDELRRMDQEVDGEWAGRFEGRLVGRVDEVVHRLSGRRVSTRVHVTSPLRSVGNPLDFMVRSQEAMSSLYQFRLDEAAVGVDLGYHLD